MIQPGPALSSADPPGRTRAARGARGRKRRKSTCSPICATSENTTDAAAPNSSRSKMTAGVAVLDPEIRPVHEARRGSAYGDDGEGQQVQHQPDRLGPELKAADQA